MNRIRHYLAVSALTTFFAIPAILRADCPDGTRDTTEAERQEYLKTANALRAAVLPAPAGWRLKTPRPVSTGAPTFTCKGLKLIVEPYEVTYVSVEQEQLNAQHGRETEARIAALRKLPLEQQKQADDLTRQGMQLSGQSATARRNNPAEAARLLEQAKQCYAKSRAIYQAHTDATEPQIRAIAGDLRNYRNPEVQVHLAVSDLRAKAGIGAEQVLIPGVPQSFFDSQKSLVMLFGHDATGRNVRVWLDGDRERVMTIARLFAESGLPTLASK